MMQVIVSRTWREEFAAVAAKREEFLHREKAALFDDRERERRKQERGENELRDAETFAVIQLALATPEAVAEFRLQLDEYDSSTVEALMENREALEAVRERIDALLEDAYVLPDGRRVFKTKDGQRVFDELGREISPDLIDPDEIDDTRTKWEPYKAATQEHIRLTEEREQLLAYQNKLDAARERLDKGEITEAELDDLKSELAADMPDAVRAKLGIEQSKPDAEATLKETAPALPGDMDALMRQTGLGAGPGGM